MIERRRTALLLVLLLLVTAAALVPTASAGGPQPLAPGQAQALANAAPAAQTGSVTRPATPQEAAAAAALPGATVSTPVQSVAATTAAATSCWATAFWRQWGTWPYEQKITDTTYWCAVYGDHITYISSSVNGTGTLCGTSWTTSQLISGGIGYSWFVQRSSAGFSCPTAIPWVSLHPSHYTDVSRNDWGSTAEVGSN